VRLVIVKVQPHVASGNSRGVDSDGFLRILTNLLNVPAEIIARIYEHRWQIEVFFRTLKHLLGCRHLLSHHPDGIRIQTYGAIIACLLINLWTGRQPTKRTHEMLCDYLMGWADEDELLAHLAKLKTRDAATSRSPRGRGVGVLSIRVPSRCPEISAAISPNGASQVP
jgi:hypothetical protein